MRSWRGRRNLKRGKESLNYGNVKMPCGIFQFDVLWLRVVLEIERLLSYFICSEKLMSYNNHQSCIIIIIIAIKANKTAIVVNYKINKVCLLRHMTILCDHNTSTKVFNKPRKYKNLFNEIEKMWNLSADSIPVAGEELGMIKKGTERLFKNNPWYNW